MRKTPTLFCIALLCCSLLIAPAAFAGPDRGDSLRSRGAADDTLVVWRSQVRLHHEIARLLGVLPFAVPALPERGDDPIRGGLGLSDDPDPTGARGEDEGEEENSDGPGTDQAQPAEDEDNSITQLGMR